VNGLAQRLERGRGMTLAGAVGGRGGRGIGVVGRRAQTAMAAHHRGITATGAPITPAVSART